MFFTESNSFFMTSDVHRNGRKLRSSVGTSLVVLLGFVLFCLPVGRLCADDEGSCRACIKSFWHDACYFEMTAFNYVTDDFVEITTQNGQTSLAEFRQIASDHRLFSKSVKESNFPAAHEHLKRIFSRHVVKNGKKDNRKYSELSPEEQKMARASMQAIANGMPKLIMQQNNSMRVRKLSVSGGNATAEITYSDGNFQHDKKLTLKKHQGKWKISKVEHLRSNFIRKAAPKTGN